MKLIKQSFDKNSSGFTTLMPQDKEDLWQLYNLIQKNDEIKLQTTRNVAKNATKGASKQERKNVVLTINVEDIDYAPEDEVMRIRGKTTVANEFVPIQSYHTAEIQLNKSITVIKTEWDEINYDIVVKSCSIESKAEIGAIVFEEGVAHLCLVTDNLTVLRNKIEKSIPKKRRGDNSSHDKGLVKFYDLIISTMMRNFNLDNLKVIILASPGFLSSNLLSEIKGFAQKNDDKTIFKNISKFVTANCSTGYLQGLEEVLKDENIRKNLADTQFAQEVIIFEKFQKLLNDDDETAWYGPKECERAIQEGAVKQLLITDTLFRNNDIELRKHFILLVEQVKQQGGEVYIFSSLHDSGNQLDQLTGIAVILKYSMDLYSDDEE